MKRRKSFSRWLAAWTLISMLGVGILGGAGLSALAAPRQASALDVIINEVAWGGTAADSADEWIELYNPGGSDIDLMGWTLNATDGTPSISLSGTITAGGYFLLERTNDSTVSDIAADLIYTGALENGVDELELRDDSINLIDTANLGGGTWFAGTAGPDYYTMERKSVVADSSTAWASNNGLTINGLDASSNPLNGTPGQQNSQSFSPLDVIISEVAWDGTQAYAGDEWIELHNPGVSIISLDGWVLTNDTGSFYISFDSADSIASGGYFLIERGSGNATSETEDKTYSSIELDDAGDSLRLLDNVRQEIDTANTAGGAWPAGGGANFSSMERVIEGGVPRADGPFAWITNVGTVKNGKDAAGHDIYGTPGAQNWAATVVPTNTPAPTLTPTPVGALTVVINEVAWGGTEASSDDEWIELYNPGTSNISLNGWTLSSSDGSPIISLSGTIAADGYFLLERTDDDTVASIAADLIYSGSLSNSGEVLRLYDPSNNQVDSANDNGSSWPAGNSTTHSSMERSLISTDTDFVWVTYDESKDTGTRDTDASGNEINGTPGRGNAQTNVTPTPTLQNSSGGGTTGGSSGTSGSSTAKPILGISEFLPRPGHDWNNDGIVDVFDEFIEIINAGQIEVNLSAYRLDDEENLGSSPFTLPSITLEPGERAVFYASETGILLSDAGDTVRLLQSSVVVDAYTYGPVPDPDHTWCRIPDRLGYWNEPCFPTPGNPNALTGKFPPLPGPVSDQRDLVCLLPDTTPEVFVYAECEVYGDEIWSRKYWDSADDSEPIILFEPEKWETVFK